MNRNSLLLLGAIGAVAVFGIGWYLTSTSTSSTSSGPQNAVNPNAQIGAGAYAQGTQPDIGNLLSYNQLPGVLSAPQATSVSPLQNWMNPAVTGVYGNQSFGGWV
jgi:hypothetical protein